MIPRWTQLSPSIYLFRADAPAGLVETLDRMIASLPPGEILRRELLEARMLAVEQEDMVIEARQAIEKLEQIVKKVTSPANRIGTFLAAPGSETAQIVVGGADYYCNLRPPDRCSSAPARDAGAGERGLRDRGRSRL